MNRPEQHLQKQLSAWIRLQYPDVYFLSDHSGMYFSSWPIRIYMKASRSKHAALDLVFLEPRGVWHGLVLELKKETPFKSTGELRVNEHLQAQEKTVNHLRKKNFKTEWGWEFEQCKKIITEYLKHKPYYADKD